VAPIHVGAAGKNHDRAGRHDGSISLLVVLIIDVLIMNVHPDATSVSPTSATGKTLRGTLWVALLLALGGSCTYALIHPERMPDRIGEIVEDVTGANAHPVKLVLPPVQPLSAVALIGKEMFYDKSLSASGQQSCASCHNPDHGYGPIGKFPVQLGGPHLNLPGYRPPPSLAYLYRQAPFSIGPDAGETDTPVSIADQASAAIGTQRAVKSADVTPAAPAMVPQGGLFWDGRADSLQNQSIEPMLNPVEMANTSADEVAGKLQHAAYIDQFKKLFGEGIVSHPDLLLSEAMFALGRYQLEESSFHAFSSKYDYWLQGKARLTSAELRGLRLFNDPNKANCAGCHLSQPSPDGLPPVFTDTQYEALGVPRNPALPANKDPNYHDLGICGPIRKDLATQTQYCGMFLTPTLRNSASREVFFHNGIYHTLKQVMDFYNFRDLEPEKVYSRDASGKAIKYDDLPVKYQANIDTSDGPFNRKPGDPLSMSDQDINDIIAFIKTLNDGYKP
jgi:cytochrome c peroxidase